MIIRTLIVLELIIASSSCAPVYHANQVGDKVVIRKGMRPVYQVHADNDRFIRQGNEFIFFYQEDTIHGSYMRRSRQ